MPASILDFYLSWMSLSVHDQVNLGPLPRSLVGRGEVQIILDLDGTQTNPVTAVIQ